MRNIVPAARARAEREAADIQRAIEQAHHSFPLRVWDWNFYAEQVRKDKYALDESQIRPYFELNNVLEKGVFWSASQLFGIRFSQRHDLPVYHPDVNVYEIFDADDTPLALFYTDFFKRDNKSGGAWMSNFVDQSTLLGTKPVIYNVCNYTKPQAGQPALLSWMK